MDGKGGRRLSKVNDRPRRRNVVDFGKKYARFLVEQRQALIAGILITGAVLLAFGVFSRIQAPTLSSVPAGATAVNYSTFKEQVSAGNVLGVSIQGNQVNALLVHPMQQG